MMERSGPGKVAIVTAPIAKTLETTLPNLLRQWIPPDFIRKTHKPHNAVEWILVNGRRVVFWSGKGYIDSGDADLMWVDEVHDRLYLDQPRWDRLMGRLRGAAEYKELVISGIAIESPEMEDRFYKPMESQVPATHIELPGLKASWVWANDQDYCKRAIANKPKPLMEAMLNGGRVPPPQSAFPHLDLTLGGNLVDLDATPWMEGTKPVNVSLDPGEQYGVFVCAPLKRDGQDCVLGLESMCLDRYSTDQVLEYLAKETDYKIGRVFVDTDSVRDTRVLVRQHLPGVPVEDLKKGGKMWRLKAKQDRFSWAIQAGDGFRRFLIHERMLTEGKRALVNLLRKADLKPDGTLTKPNDEHVRDAAIYATCIMLKPKAENKGGTL